MVIRFVIDIPEQQTRNITKTICADHLAPWGWNIYRDEGPDWCNWESNGYWGFANFIRSKGISDKCVTDGGLWDVSVVLHGELSDVEPQDQKYMGPDGKQRRVIYAAAAENHQLIISIGNSCRVQHRDQRKARW